MSTLLPLLLDIGITSDVAKHVRNGEEPYWDILFERHRIVFGRDLDPGRFPEWWCWWLMPANDGDDEDGFPGWKIYRDEEYNAAWLMVRAIGQSIRDVVDGSKGATS